MMRIRAAIPPAAVTALILFVFATPGYCQIKGTEFSFGEEGRLYSKGEDDSFLLWQQNGYYGGHEYASGAIRTRKKYEGGGYEDQRLHFYITCTREGISNFVSVVSLSEREDSPKPLAVIGIERPDKRPSPAKLAAYNLYWAACRAAFQKFR